VAPTPAPNPQPPPTTGNLDAEEAAFITLLNQYRQQNGLGALRVSPALTAAARWHSGDMAARGYFNHVDSLGRTPFDRVLAFGYPSRAVGENIAAGLGDAAGTFNQWRNSPGHNQNMLGNYQVTGIGRVTGGPYRVYWTSVFGTVVD
jgi:uncharacterized protein YkwD